MDEIFVFCLAGVLGIMFAWGFRTLPKEKWQILAAIPRQKKRGGWVGENITYYGLFNANAYTIAAALFLLMMGAIRAPLAGMAAVSVVLMGVCIPASRRVARIVENKKYTFTVGGASFVGIVTAPFIVGSVNMSLGKWLGFEINGMIFLAAVSVAYAFGEGIGRLACISFGCCYGKPVSKCSPLFQRFFKKCHFVFSGKTKKIAYADHLDNEAVVPVQGITSVIYCGTGLVSIYLFLKGWYATAFLLSLSVTQIWRVCSEFLRADYRGDNKISAYQVMGGVGVLYGMGAAFFYAGSSPVSADLTAGISSLWHPGVLLGLQGLWVFSFFYTGRSKVTGSEVSFHVIEERV